MALSGKLTISASLNYTNPLDLVEASAPFSQAFEWVVATGTGTSQADVQWSDQRTLGPSATEDIDLQGGLTGGAFGTVTIAKLKALMFFSLAANLNNINVSRPAGATGVPLFLAVSDGLVVGPGGWFAWSFPTTGVTVAAGTADLITITNAAGTNSVTYNIVLVGTSV